MGLAVKSGFADLTQTRTFERLANGEFLNPIHLLRILDFVQHIVRESRCSSGF